jgi:ABC-type Mn2+/Zn2+ transport system permease subunit
LWFSRWHFLGDALSHAVLPGVAIAYLTGGSLTFGAWVAAVVVALGISFLSDEEEIKEDTAIGIFFTAALALGVALISTIQTYAIDLTHILFGNVLGVTVEDLQFIVGVGLLVLLAVFLFYRFFLVLRLIRSWQKPEMECSFDSIHAAGFDRLYDYHLDQHRGSQSVTAMLITPAATALMLTKKLWQTMLTAAVFGALSGFFGLYLSYFGDISSGASIVLVSTLFFIVVYLRKKLLNGRSGLAKRG